MGLLYSGGRLTHEEAVDLFNHVVADIKNSSLPTKPSKIDLGQSGHKRKVYVASLRLLMNLISRQMVEP